MKNGKANEDISRILKLNNKLERQVAMFSSLANSLTDCLFLISENGEILFYNDYAKKILNLKNSYENIFKYLPELENDISKSLELKENIEKEVNLAYPEKLILKASIAPFRSADGAKENEVSLVLRDITAQKISTGELIESEKISSILKLASGIAHEIGNPLNSMALHLQIALRSLSKLEDSGAAKKISNSINVCEDEIERLKGIIENFLKALRPVRPNLSEIDALAPLPDTIKIVEAEVKNRNITINISSESALPSIMGDESLLKQLYFNLIKNSLEAVQDGGQISISAHSDDNFVIITFEDNGSGISSENMAHMFEPYFTTKEYGHGLGMMIIENIVKAHKGFIKVDSPVDSGAKFTIKLPRKTPKTKYLAGR